MPVRNGSEALGRSAPGSRGFWRLCRDLLAQRKHRRCPPMGDARLVGCLQRQRSLLHAQFETQAVQIERLADLGARQVGHGLAGGQRGRVAFDVTFLFECSAQRAQLKPQDGGLLVTQQGVQTVERERMARHLNRAQDRRGCLAQAA